MKEFQEQETLNNAQIACELCGKGYSYEQIMQVLKDSSVIEKQSAILALGELKNKEDAKFLLKNLIGQDGRIREVTAFKINELIKIYPQYFQDEECVSVFIKSVIDVNPAICRFMIESLQFVDDKEILVKKIVDEINSIIAELSEIPKNSRKYLLNKKAFKIYWFLEALIELSIGLKKVNNSNEVVKIVEKLVSFSEYTIREKLHKLSVVFAKLGYNEFEKYIEVFKADENFYVRNLCSKGV